MERQIRTLRWILMVSIMGVGSYMAYQVGHFSLIAEYDITCISYVIGALFILGTVLTGYCHFCFNWKWTRVIKFIAAHEMTLGMIGTVIGFIYTLHTCFTVVDVTNTGALQAAVSKMSTGMGAALCTTAAGLIASLLLKLQLFNLSGDHNE